MCSFCWLFSLMVLMVIYPLNRDENIHLNVELEIWCKKPQLVCVIFNGPKQIWGVRSVSKIEITNWIFILLFFYWASWLYYIMNSITCYLPLFSKKGLWTRADLYVHVCVWLICTLIRVLLNGLEISFGEKVYVDAHLKIPRVVVTIVTYIITIGLGPLLYIMTK